MKVRLLSAVALVLLAQPSLIGASGQISTRVRVAFAPYSPGLILLVGADNEQIDVLALQSGGSPYPAADRRIAPLARLKQSYVLSSSLRFPVRFYYGDNLLALISE
jgi:hypothetical protein